MYLIFGGFNYDRFQTSTGGAYDLLGVKDSLDMLECSLLGCALEYFAFDEDKSIEKPNHIFKPFFHEGYYHTGFSWVHILNSENLRVVYFILRNYLDERTGESFCIEYYYKDLDDAGFSESKFVYFENRQVVKIV